MKTVKKKAVRRRNLVLGALLLSVLLAALASVTVAQNGIAAASSEELTVYDPFRFVRTPVASDVSLSGTAVSTVVSVVARPAIRVPVRAPMRSAFHPIY